MTLARLLLLLVNPVLSKVLLALGFSVVTIVGVPPAVASIKGLVVQHLSGAPQAMLMLAGLAGVWEGLGYTFGAVTFAVTMWGIRRATSVLGVAQ